MSATSPDEGIPIDPLWARGYAVARGAWRQVFWLPPGAIEINSGAQVHGPPADTDWHVRCPTSRGTSIALYRMSETGRALDGGHEEVTLRDFLAENPRYMVGQTIRHAGSTWRVAAAAGHAVRLDDDAGATRQASSWWRPSQSKRDASSRVIVEENLKQLTALVVVLVDVG